MKDTFLKLVARDLVKTYGANLSRLVIIFPYSTPINQLSNLLYIETNGSLTKPVFTTITEHFKKISNFEIPDNIHLICRLFWAYREVLDKHNEQTDAHVEAMTFDEFYQWGEMMLSDFNDIDKALVDARTLLRDVSHIKDINNEAYLTDEQKEVLQKFFLTFSQIEDSAMRMKYQSVWNLLGDIYTAFNDGNALDRVAYEGRLFKEGIGRLANAPADDATIVAFVGFNAVSSAEHKLMQIYNEAGRAIFYWDYDTYYCNDDNEAGRFVKYNIDTFGSKLDAESFSNLAGHNEIEIVKSATKSSGINYAGAWLDSVSPEGGNDTVIVVTNSDIIPTLNKFLLAKSDNYTLLTKHPISTTVTYASMMRYIDALMSEHADAADEFTPLIFIDSVDEKAHELAEKYKQADLNKNSMQAARIAIESSACDAVLESVKYIKELIATDVLPAGLQTVRQLLQQQICACVVTPAGADEKGAKSLPEIPICELSETRLLDFKNVLVLGCNEGDLPARASTASLIPNQVRAAYGLPTTDNRSAIGAYNFFRLIQRAENVSLVFTTESAGISSKEMSRFVLQIIGEDRIAYKVRNITYPAQAQKSEAVVVNKDESMFANMKHLEATSLYQYIRCPLIFYYSKVAKIRTPQPNVNKMPANLFGTLFHEAVQLFYEAKADAPEITRDMLQRALHNDEAELDAFIDEAFKNNSVPDNAIIKKIVKGYFKNVLQYDMKNTPFKIRPEYIEKFLYTEIPVEIKGGKTLTVRVGGKFDRVDSVTIDGREVTRVVDYKTSKWKKSLEADNCEAVFGEPQSDKHYDYIFQTFLYCLSLSENVNKDADTANKQTVICPAVFFITAANKADFNPYISMGEKEKEPIFDFSTVKNEFRDELQTLLHEIFDLDVPFKERNEDVCKFCDYKILCNK